jgi:hypothetical protein
MTALAALLAGLFAALPFSPLEWVSFIAEQEFARP